MAPLSASRRWRAGGIRRWGELGAELLFAVAERSDHLVALSDHVQRKAIALLAAWPESLAALRVSINVVAADIARPGFAPGLLRIIRDAGVDSGRITVEITESGLIEDLGAAATLLAELRAGGLRIAIDDFGTGYSSLAYLKALPLDYLKLDKRLSEDITGSARDSVVVRGVIEMARSLGLGVIAEGGRDRGAADRARPRGLHALSGLPVRAATQHGRTGCIGRGEAEGRRMKFGVAAMLLMGAQIALAAPTPERAVLAAMADSAAGWNSGNLNRFMAIYSDDPGTSYVVKDGIVSGKAVIAKSYAPRFAPEMAEKRGMLSFDRLRFVVLDATHALLIARFRLKIGSKEETGATSLVFRHEAGGWKIIADHSS